MKEQYSRVPWGVTLTLLSSIALGGCGLLGGEEATLDVEPAPQPEAAQNFPSPAVNPTGKAVLNAALTRPTNPNDRLKAIKSGRNDPFQVLVTPPSQEAAQASSGSPTPQKSAATGREAVASQLTNSYDRFLNRVADSIEGEKPGSQSGDIKLPELPAAPELAAVKVTGVVELGGSPRAIVQAPGEPTSRTVGIGDRLMNGQLVVKNIDMSNRAEPVVVFQQGATRFAVGIGRDPVLLASAGSGAQPLASRALMPPL